MSGADTANVQPESRVSHWEKLLREHPELLQSLTPKLNKYIPVSPTAPQMAFLLLPHMEALYGGAAGGGKSIALLMAALQYVEVPGYSSILFRKSYADLSLPGALMDVAHQWLHNTDAKWDFNNKTWKFPSGASLVFGYLDSAQDIYKYQGSKYTYIGFDEVSQIRPESYTYLFSRLRRETNLPIPLRVRGATNPGGDYGEYYFNRFLTEEARKAGRIFIPAKLTDNPYLDQAEYQRALDNLDPVTRAQLLNGDWSMKAPGKFFKREWFNIVSQAPEGIKWIRFWDLSTRIDEKRESDWTAGALVGMKDGRLYIKHMAHFQGTPQEVEDFVLSTAYRDGRNVPIYMEQESASSGLFVIEHFKNKVLKGFNFEGRRPKGKKETRPTVWSSYVQTGNCFLIGGDDSSWIPGFIDECEAFPNKHVHDDRVDAVSGGVAILLENIDPKIRTFALYRQAAQDAPVSRARKGWF